MPFHKGKCEIFIGARNFYHVGKKTTASLSCVTPIRSVFLQYLEILSGTRRAMERRVCLLKQYG